MTPAFSTLFNLNTLQSKVTDLFNYGSLIYDAVYGNVTAKIGNSIFHQNTNFDSNADIVIGTNDNVSFNLPTSSGKVQSGSYTFIYDEMIVNEVLAYASVGSGYITATAGASPVTQVDLGVSPVDLATIVTTLLATLDDVRVGVYDSSDNLLGSAQITGTSGGNTILCESLSYTGTVAKARIIGTNTYTTEQTYTWNGCDEITPKLCVEVDCYYAQITVIDATKYPSYVDTLSRTMTIQYPRTSDGSPVAPPVTTSNASVTIGPNIWSGNWTSSLSSVLNWEQEDDLLVTQTLTDYVETNVTCDPGLCETFECINGFRKKLIAAIRNGAQNYQELFQQNVVINSYLGCYNIAVSCKLTSEATKILNELKDYLGRNNCSCGCGGSQNQGAPTEIFPLFSQS